MKDLLAEQIYGERNREVTIIEDWLYFTDLHKLFPRLRVTDNKTKTFIERIIDSNRNLINVEGLPKVYVIDNKLADLVELQREGLSYIFISDFYNDYSKKYLIELSDEKESNFLELFDSIKDKSSYCQKIFNTFDILRSEAVRKKILNYFNIPGVQYSFAQNINRAELGYLYLLKQLIVRVYGTSNSEII